MPKRKKQKQSKAVDQISVQLDNSPAMLSAIQLSTLINWATTLTGLPMKQTEKLAELEARRIYDIVEHTAYLVGDGIPDFLKEEIQW